MGGIFGSERTRANVQRLERERADFVKAGRKKKGVQGNKEAKRLAGEYEAAKQADDVMTAAETGEDPMEAEIKKPRATRKRNQIAAIRSGY